MDRLDALKQFLEREPNDSFTRYAIGLEYASQKNYSEAIRMLEELRAMDENYVPTYYQLAEYYRAEKAPLKAIQIYREGIQKARAMNDLHAASELEAALDDLENEVL